MEGQDEGKTDRKFKKKENLNRAPTAEDLPDMKVKPLGSCMTPVEAPAVLRTVPLALMLLLVETGAR